MEIGFLKLKGSIKKEIDYVNDQAIIYNFKAIKDETDFYKQVGKNTFYIKNPEEILADNFAFAVMNIKGLSSQWVIDRIQKLLKR